MGRRRRAPARLTFSTPLDGTVRATLGRAARGHWRVALLDARTGHTLARGGTTVSAKVCGQDAVTVAVTRRRGGRPFRLEVSLP